MKAVTFKTKVLLLKHLSGMHYLEIPKSIVEKLGGKLKLRLVCTVNKKVKYQCGLMALGQGKAYITITKKRMDELGVKLNSSVQVSLVKDESKFGLPMPEELKEVLAQDDEATMRFEKLSPGKQRYIIQYVSSVKNPDKRIERSLLLLENLKLSTPGKETFRQMLGLPPRD